MSHFSRLRTTIKNKEILLSALKEMGFTPQEGAHIKGFAGRREVEIAVRMQDGYDIGFIRNEDGLFEVIADWWGVKGATKETFSTRLQEKLDEVRCRIRREYALKTVLEQTKAQGFNLVERRHEEDGTIRIVVRRWT